MCEILVNSEAKSLLAICRLCVEHTAAVLRADAGVTRRGARCRCCMGVEASGVADLQFKSAGGCVLGAEIRHESPVSGIYKQANLVR